VLTEFPNVRQEPLGYRRLFCDEQYDLYAWYDAPGGRLFGFQLVYFEEDGQKALTWTEDEGYRHNAVDGWDSGRFNKTPLLVPDGTFVPQMVLGRLTPLLDEVDPAVRRLVVERINGFPGPAGAP
jgi:hypothetical protein